MLYVSSFITLSLIHCEKKPKWLTKLTLLTDPNANYDINLNLNTNADTYSKLRSQEYSICSTLLHKEVRKPIIIYNLFRQKKLEIGPNHKHDVVKDRLPGFSLRGGRGPK